jgi:hypothetical protein
MYRYQLVAYTLSLIVMDDTVVVAVSISPCFTLA